MIKKINKNELRLRKHLRVRKKLPEQMKDLV